jgi:hypothetical protein
MTETQQDDLLVEWSFCDPKRQQEIIDEFVQICNGHFSRDRFLDFLKDRLQIEGYLEK